MALIILNVELVCENPTKFDILFIAFPFFKIFFMHLFYCRISIPISSIRNYSRSMFMRQSSEENNDMIECGPPPPEEFLPELTTIAEGWEDNTAIELTTQICTNEIRQELLDIAKATSGPQQIKLYEKLEKGPILIKECEKMISQMTLLEKNQLLLWCCFTRKLDIVNLLKREGAEINYSNEEGYTPLHLAALSCPLTTNYLVAHGANVNALTRNHYSPLRFAAFGNSVESVRILISNGADVLSDGANKEESLLQSAIRANATAVLEVFIDEGADVNKKVNGMNAIHFAADLGNDKCLEILLNAPNADPHLKMSRQEKAATALHLAAEEGSVKCIELLLKKGARPHVKNWRGSTVSNYKFSRLLFYLRRNLFLDFSPCISQQKCQILNVLERYWKIIPT